ncbi:hypothetical protein EDB92DRAFT_1813945 [Lactarius akahatsu]|uniref:Uncharacterized protein n=1 Tax=Lactarius akahatsu TaxID=416441 RepID=A0AAD4LMI6_9AGAM|nr:hypothetical protein EDB92DRAFT_1813945 [Lactarius akahatsu]
MGTLSAGESRGSTPGIIRTMYLSSGEFSDGLCSRGGFRSRTHRQAHPLVIGGARRSGLVVVIDVVVVAVIIINVVVVGGAHEWSATAAIAIEDLGNPSQVNPAVANHALQVGTFETVQEPSLSAFNHHHSRREQPYLLHTSAFTHVCNENSQTLDTGLPILAVAILDPDDKKGAQLIRIDLATSIMRADH